ncbi:hypothetical protein CMV30_07510 [Nibricoccus aquaticus]|uniref:Uncharacterized protein n=2 Tax=Nibricoccus aquaticus TaxID=2576891 RepID=A0A290Q6A9_9BACT|nr:hypothetical protein CMV30_07510 [Nibricoccus aquaticus]
MMEVIHPISLKGTLLFFSPIKRQAVDQMTGKHWRLLLRDRQLVDLFKQAEVKRRFDEHVRSGIDPLMFSDVSFAANLRLSDLAAPPAEIEPSGRSMIPSSNK